MTCDRAGGLPHREGVDEHEGVVPVEELVREMEPTDAEVGDLDAIGHRPINEALRDLDAVRVVAEEDVADSGHQHSGPGHDRASVDTSLSSSSSSAWK